ncbi:MAG: Na/Pi cotransporter family protein [Clostridia bacterium]|nr:Na/Pi cotransporter family protein [Clostridia bacterium]
MNIFDVLTLIGGLCLFLFGMNIMGQALERRAGNSLRDLLGKLTTNKFAGLLTGLGVTAVIQSSSATTVMVVGFVNSGLMSLKQAINVIMGANIGTTVTAWILSLSGISGDNLFVQLLKPMSFTPILALLGIVFYLFCKSGKKQDTGMILLGFATLMFGMDIMTEAVSGLKDVPAFRELFLLFKNPVLGVLAGAILTAIIQSSSASVGILQALSATGAVSIGATIPIIMGQNIGTCITALLSSFGTNRNAKRAAVVHLSFNVIGTIVCLVAFWLVDLFLSPALFEQTANHASIAVAHSVFNVLCTLLLLPMSGLLERLAHKLVRDAKKPEEVVELDERLLNTPPFALARCRAVTSDMAVAAVDSLKIGLASLNGYLPEQSQKVTEAEDKTDHYEDILGSYLVKLSGRQISREDSAEAAKLLKNIGDFERIADHAVNLVESAEEMHQKDLHFTEKAQAELGVINGAVAEIVDLTLHTFQRDDLKTALEVEALEQVVDDLKDQLRSRHILRLQTGECSYEMGFVWSDILTDLERVSDHCSNIAGGVVDAAQARFDIHESLHQLRDNNPEYQAKLASYRQKYAL